MIAEHEGSAPKSVVNAAKKAVAARDKVAKEENDDNERFEQVWVVFDTEGPQNSVRNKDAKNAIEQARQLGFRIAVSNPTFEFWLLLHFEFCVDVLKDGSSVEKRLKQHLPRYSKSTEAYTSTKQNLKNAIDNARRIRQERCVGANGHPCDCHPSTLVDLLMDVLSGEG